MKNKFLIRTIQNFENEISIEHHFCDLFDDIENIFMFDICEIVDFFDDTENYLL